MVLSIRRNAADTCRANEIRVGDRLSCDSGFGAKIIEITAIGETHILARTISGPWGQVPESPIGVLGEHHGWVRV